jgi:uncharacterized membrane protein
VGERAARLLARARRGLHREVGRSGAAAVLGVLVAVPVARSVDVDLPSSVVEQTVVPMTALAGFQAAYVLLTLLVWGGLVGPALVDAARSMPLRRSVRSTLDGSQPGAGVAVSAASIGLVAAGALMPQAVRAADTASTVFTLVLGLVLVVSAWAAMTTTYAVDYARRHLHADGRGGLVFPDEPVPVVRGVRRPDLPGDGRAFSDYLYLAAAVSTSFGSTDVVVTSRAMRRTVTGHTVVAFAFNTIIITLAVGAVATLAG